MVKKPTEKGHGVNGCPSSSELSENKPRQNFRLGDITWVRQSGSSWWPAQVVDEACTSSKPKKKTGHDALVRLYGTCQYLYIDPWKSNVEFEMILKQESKTAMECFHEVLQKELSNVKSCSDYDEGAVNSKAMTSSRKVRKQEGLKQSGHRGIKELATAKGLGDKAEHEYSAEQDQEVGSNATTGVAVWKGRKQEDARQSSPPHDKEQVVDKVSSENSAEGLRDKTQKQVSFVRDKKCRKMPTVGTSVARREGLRRSGRTNGKEYLDAAEDSTSQLHDTSASENATEGGDITSENQNQHKNDYSMVDGTLGSHEEIKAMVTDILLGDIIARQHAAEMAFVDEVIYGICDATKENVTGGDTAATKGGRGIKRSGSRLEADSSNGTLRPRKRKLTNLVTVNYQITKDNDSNSSPSRDAAMEESGLRSARQIKIMQNLGLIAPSGSPFSRNALVAATHR